MMHCATAYISLLVLLFLFFFGTLILSTAFVSVRLFCFTASLASMSPRVYCAIAVGGPKKANENWKHISYILQLHTFNMSNAIYSFTTIKRKESSSSAPFLHVFLFLLLYLIYILSAELLFVNSDNLTHIFSSFFPFSTYSFGVYYCYYYHFRFYSKRNVYQSHSRILFDDLNVF